MKALCSSKKNKIMIAIIILFLLVVGVVVGVVLGTRSSKTEVNNKFFFSKHKV